MISILNQNRYAVINFNNFQTLIIGEHIKNLDGEKEYYVAVTFSPEHEIALGYYETEERAKEILTDIYSKISEGKSTYKMPKE